MEQEEDVAGKPQDKMQHLHSQLDGVTEIVTETVKRLMARQENLIKLEETSDGMEKEAQHFKQTSQRVARSYWWKNVKLIVALVVVVLIVVLIIILLATGVIPVSAPVTPIVAPTKAP